jgi:hypothetical protein
MNNLIRYIIYADGVGLLGENINMINNTKILLQSNRGNGLERDIDKSKCVSHVKKRKSETK